MMITGIVLAGVGGPMALSGLVYIGLAGVMCDDDSSGDYGTTSCEDVRTLYRTVGTVMAVGGGIMTAVGIPLILVGAKRVPVNQATTSAPLPRAEVVVGPTGVALRGSF
jgi:hypothetical protein